MNEICKEYEVHNIRGEYDIEYSYEFTNELYSHNEKKFVKGEDNYLNDVYYSLKYKYMVELWSLKGFMIEYVISFVTDTITGATMMVCGYTNEVKGDIINEIIVRKGNDLYIKGEKLLMMIPIL